MRDKLKPLVGKVVTVTGMFVRYGTKDGEGARWNTAIIENVKRKGKPISDHLWFTLIKDWLNTELIEGTEVEVTGVVYEYSRKNKSHDYGLKDTKKLVVLNAVDGDPTPAKQWKYNGMDYFKYLTDKGPRWYRMNGTAVERIEFVYKGSGFQENLIPMKKGDAKYVKLIQKLFYNS